VWHRHEIDAYRFNRFTNNLANVLGQQQRNVDPQICVDFLEALYCSVQLGVILRGRTCEPLFLECRFQNRHLRDARVLGQPGDSLGSHSSFARSASLGSQRCGGDHNEPVVQT
jgi:hypothetical protein